MRIATPQIGGDRQIDRHLDAAQRPPQHHPLAVKLDHAHALVGGAVAGLEAQREGERVEPLDTARPGRHGPADGCLTPQDLSPRRVIPVRLAPPEFCPPVRCRKHAANTVGIGLTFLVNPRYRRVRRVPCLTGACRASSICPYRARERFQSSRDHLSLLDVLTARSIRPDRSCRTAGRRRPPRRRRCGRRGRRALDVAGGRGARGRGRGIRTRRGRRSRAARVRRAPAGGGVDATTSRATCTQLAERAVAMARAAPEDPYAGLADPAQLARDIPDLDLLDPDLPVGRRARASAPRAPKRRRSRSPG